MAKTLEELKAENAASEEAEKAPKQEEAEETEEVEEEPEEEAEEESDESEGEDKAEAVESWMTQEDEQASDGGDAKFGDSDVAAAKRKLRAKLERKHQTELEELKAELEKLKNGGSQQQPQQSQPMTREMPKLEDFNYDEGKYSAAMQDWVVSLTQNANRTQQAQQTHEQYERELNSKVEGHYERAARLAKEHSIAPEAYQSADLSFRSAIDEAMPGKGDTVADYLISRIGEGSEKVAYQVGRNRSKADRLTQLLREDPSGLSATMYLGELKGQMNSPVKRTSKAPKPAKRAEGGNVGGGKEKQLKRKYEGATDLQTRIDIRRQAKQMGIDVKQW